MNTEQQRLGKMGVQNCLEFGLCDPVARNAAVDRRPAQIRAGVSFFYFPCSFLLKWPGRRKWSDAASCVRVILVQGEAMCMCIKAILRPSQLHYKGCPKSSGVAYSAGR